MNREKITAKATIVWMDEELLEKIRDYAYTERISIKAAISKALTEFLKDKKLLHRPKEM